jgi:hypothetical protein
MLNRHSLYRVVSRGPTGRAEKAEAELAAAKRSGGQK